jgi:hypothetical protein
MEESAEKQRTGKEKRMLNILPYQWKKGQSGNPSGRTKGKTMKEYARELLACQTEDERQEFMHGLPKEVIWKMAEGNPKQDTEVSGELKLVTPIYGNKSVFRHNSDTKDIQPDKKD